MSNAIKVAFAVLFAALVLFAMVNRYILHDTESALWNLGLAIIFMILQRGEDRNG